MAEHGSNTPTRVPGRISTGVPGLDDVLCGGLTPDRLYLLEGTPGTDKTTVSLQFLLDGAARGERGLYVTLSETEDELRAAAASHGWSLDGIEIYELVNEHGLDPDSEQSILPRQNPATCAAAVRGASRARLPARGICRALMVNERPVIGVETDRIVFDRFSGYRTKPGQQWGVPVWKFAAKGN